MNPEPTHSDAVITAPAFSRALTLSIVGWVAALLLGLGAVMLWQSIAKTRVLNQQKIAAALEATVAGIQAQTLVVEMVAQSTERILRSVRPENPACLVTALKAAVPAFEERPELSHLGLILIATGEYGNLERVESNLLMWQYPGEQQSAAPTQSLIFTKAGFVPHAEWPGRDVAADIAPVREAALQAPRDGAWRLRVHPWAAGLADYDQREPAWGISYTKALYDVTGEPLGVLDAHFDLSAVRAVLYASQERHDIRVDVIEVDHAPRQVGSHSAAPQPMPEDYAPLLRQARWDRFVDTMQIDAERHWVAAQPLSIKGGVPWLVVASRPMPWREVLSGELRNRMVALGLVLVGLALMTLSMARQFGQPLAELARRVRHLRHATPPRRTARPGALPASTPHTSDPPATDPWAESSAPGWRTADASSLYRFQETGVLANVLDQVSDTLARQASREEQEHAQLQVLNADLAHLVTHDNLTDLPNRVLMQQRLVEAIAQARQTGLLAALLYLDLDRFKAINDSYGYLFGNIALKAAGERLAALIRPQDTVGYLNGDRFLILFTGLHDRSEAEQLTRHLTGGLKRPVSVQTRTIELAASVGVAVFPQDGETPDALINSADIAMYQAKRLGRNTWQFYTAEMGREVQDRIALERKLRDAPAAGQLRLVYQPQASLKDGAVSGCEALLRWRHPELGDVSPAHFIPIAEESGLIIQIGDWVLNTACRQAKAWLDAGLKPVRVAVNLSMRQFLQQDIVAWVAETLARTELPAQHLELELTESLLPQNMEKAIATMEALQALGVRLAIDDFGTGYSNMSCLKRFPVNILKVDQSFVKNAATSSEDAAIVRTVVTLAHTLGFTALAEGVETEQDLGFLREVGCDEIQGYFFSKPLAPEAFEAMLRDGERLAGYTN